MNNKLNIKEDNTLYSELSPHFKKLVRNPNSFRDYRETTSRIMEKNTMVLNTKIVGKQLLINKNDETNIKKSMDINDDKIVNDAYKNSLYFQQFERDLRRKPMLLFVIPQLIYCTELIKSNKMEEARYVFFATYLKPYASAVSAIFKFAVNEAQMEYTIENELNMTFGIKQQGSVYNVLLKTAMTAFDNYLPRLRDNPTDSLYYDILVSAMDRGITSFLTGIFGRYKNCAGKYANFEKTSATDSDGEEFSIDINSDAAVKSQSIKKTMMVIATRSIDDRIVNISYKLGYKMGNNTSRTFFTTTKTAISGIIKNRRNDIEKFYDALLNVYLYYDETGKGNSNKMKDLRSPRIIQTAMNVAKASNNKNPNVENVKTIMKNFLNDTSYEYLAYKSETQRRMLEKSCLLYFTILIQQNG